MGPHVATELVGIETQIMDVEGDSPRSGQLSIVDEVDPRVALSTSISVTTKHQVIVSSNVDVRPRPSTPSELQNFHMFSPKNGCHGNIF